MTEEIEIGSKDYIAIAISYGIPNENIPKFVMVYSIHFQLLFFKYALLFIILILSLMIITGDL